MAKIIKMKAWWIVYNDQWQFLVVTRREYGDFSLPKWHLDEWELLHDCALREVFEESWWRCELWDFLGVLEYSVMNGEDEVCSQVHYYSMRPLSYDIEWLFTEEISLVSWFNLDADHIEKLTHKSDRDFISQYCMISK